MIKHRPTVNENAENDYVHVYTIRLSIDM